MPRNSCDCCGRVIRNGQQEANEATCPVCGWAYSSLQYYEPDVRGEPNPLSLNEARDAWVARQLADAWSVPQVPLKPD